MGAALAADYGGTYLIDARGWRFRSAAHFAERHGLIIIIALGESIVAIGVGVTDLPISWPILHRVAARPGSLGRAVVDLLRRDRAVRRTRTGAEPAETRPKLARDAYTFLHLPMVAGIVLLALGLKKVLEYVGDTEHHHLDDPLKGVGLFALFFGVVLYLLGHVGFKRRTVHQVGVSRLITAALALIAVPLMAKGAGARAARRTGRSAGRRWWRSNRSGSPRSAKSSKHGEQPA